MGVAVSEMENGNNYPPYLLTYLFTYLLTHWLTYSMQQSTSWETNRFSASQEIPHILWKPNFITAYTSAFHLSLTWAISIQSVPPSHFLKLHLNIILPSMPASFKLSLLSGFPKPCIHLSSPPYVLHAQPISFFSIWSPEQYWMRNTDH